MNFLSVKVSEEGGSIVLDEGAFKMTVIGSRADIARPYVGRDIIFGIRPEDMQITPGTTDTPATGRHR